jgi:DNA mismatch repair ATPase MutS
MNPYHDKTNGELAYIIRDAGEAAYCMKGLDPVAEAKYLDQVNDATELYSRLKRTKHMDTLIKEAMRAAAKSINENICRDDDSPELFFEGEPAFYEALRRYVFNRKEGEAK